jgi:molybdopterin-guanine dinucleotide biosynthesis protein A
LRHALVALPASPWVVALACDMPFVRGEDLHALALAPARHPILAARTSAGACGERWEPFFARYEIGPVLSVAERRLRTGEGALQALLEETGAEAFTCNPKTLVDWDTPEDVRLAGR